MNTFFKIHALLTLAERRRAWVLLTLMMVGMLLETLGIGLIIPAITLMMQGDLVVKYPVISSILSFLGSPSQTQLIAIAMFGLVGVFLVKNLFLAFLIWKQTHFAFDVQANLSQRLFTIYLRQPYTFHLQRNSSELVRNVTGEVGIFAGVLTNALLLFTELLVLVGIAILLLFVEPLGALIVAVVLGGAAWGFHRVTRERISQWGVERQLHDGLRLQHLQQGLGGAKDVKLLGRESDFLRQFHTHNVKSARVWKLQSTLQNFPRLMFELLAVTGLAILVLSMLSQGRDMTSIIPTLGLFAAAAFRLMPSANRVLGAIQALRYSLPVVNTLYEEIKLISPEPVCQKTSDPNILMSEIRLMNVAYQYPGVASLALDGISINIRKGESIGLIGSSGSGKSTLVDVILGLLAPSDGQVGVDGVDIQRDLRKWQDQIGYVPQSIYLTDDTLKRNVAFGLPSEQIDDLAVERAIKAAQLEEFVTTLPEGLNTVVGERGVRLSGGQRQRIGIARALYHDPAVLVLDEATSALDGVTERGVMGAVTALQGSKTIIVVAHRLSTVENCDRLFHLERGKVIGEGPPEKILSFPTI
ncbi:ABC transporter ATP-binding protein [Herminiimonas arsenitoxidans]|uniref:ABC transporter ATP-binding protein n=1 Tax=Herminiimonas arsenitoxidans TaxID=1809410 RepID=UPI0009703C11|nr:ABC transporter ATP-binding protein [Herminiimonas arsenitoxidans]